MLNPIRSQSGSGHRSGSEAVGRKRAWWFMHTGFRSELRIRFASTWQGHPEPGSGSGFLHCRDLLGGAIFAAELGERDAKKTRTLKGVFCTCYYCTGFIKNWLKAFLLWLPVCGTQPLVALCLLLMKMQWQSLQWPHCLPACSSQQQFLQRMSSCTAQSCSKSDPGRLRTIWSGPSLEERNGTESGTI